MSSVQIPPSVDTTWRDDVQAANDALLVMKLARDPANVDLLTLYAIEAGDLICLYLDRTDTIPGVIPGTPPPALRGAHRDVTVELYRRKDAAFGVLNAWSPDDGAIRISADPLRGVYARITPYKANWGLA